MALVDTLPTLYEYYTSGGISAGLSADQPYFTLNNKNITIFSGAMHYFRVPREYWRDRLRKMRAAGLNTVETYVPWNLHEPEENVYDFGNGGTDWQDFLDIHEFLQVAQEEDLFAIVRPGPYICAEWDFGGFPSWLLRYKGIQLRTSQPLFMNHVKRYFSVLLPILALLQFTLGGPIIAFQVENEYGSTHQVHFVPDKIYLMQLRDMLLANGIVELLFTADAPSMSEDVGTLAEHFLQTANFGGFPAREFEKLKHLQRNKPFMAMEFWTGWFDHWSEEHHLRNNTEFIYVLNSILAYPASVNMYMFHGGTSFGFLNGANVADGSIDNQGYQPDTTSYDYDAPISENGDYSEKYYIVKELINLYNTVKVRTPAMPILESRVAYGSIRNLKQLDMSEILNASPYVFESRNLLPMEFLQINNNNGQSYGYIVYRKTNIDLPPHSYLKIEGRVCDSVMVMINGELISPILENVCDLNGFGYWRIEDSTLRLTDTYLHNVTLDLIVENWGRVNFGHVGQYFQLKGLWQGPVTINEKRIFDWEIIPLEFKKSWTNSLVGWHDIESRKPGPALYKGILNIDYIADTYIDMSEWTKGIVIINGFVLGRYVIIGPQKALYLPAPLIKHGLNEIVIFENFLASNLIKFSREPIFETIYC